VCERGKREFGVLEMMKKTSMPMKRERKRREKEEGKKFEEKWR